MKRKCMAWLLAVLVAVSLWGCRPQGADPTEGSRWTGTSGGVQYIRTDGWVEDAAYPAVVVIRSRKELLQYYEQNKERYDLGRRNQGYADSSIGFLDACDRYDDSYFLQRILLLVLLEEGSGSIRHTVTAVNAGVDGKLTVRIDRDCPEAGTCDMAQWHIFVEPEPGVTVRDPENVILELDENRVRFVECSHGYANISLRLPEGWMYETLPWKQETGNFGIRIWPRDGGNGSLTLEYCGMFGVCGTGLHQKTVTVGPYRALQGIYDGRKGWDFLYFPDLPGDYTVWNHGSEAWREQYGQEAMEILQTVRLAKGIMTKDQALQRVFEQTGRDASGWGIRFDCETATWTVTLPDNAGGTTTATVDAKGNVLLNTAQ